jgi:hypothetical protein
LTINDWLSSFRGAAGPDLRVLFDGKHDSVRTLDDFRSVRPELAALSDSAIQPTFDEFVNRYALLNDQLSSRLVQYVQWKREPELARLIRGNDSSPGWAKLGNGVAMYNWLKSHASTKASRRCRRMRHARARICSTRCRLAFQQLQPLLITRTFSDLSEYGEAFDCRDQGRVAFSVADVAKLGPKI